MISQLRSMIQNYNHVYRALLDHEEKHGSDLTLIKDIILGLMNEIQQEIDSHMEF